MTLAIKGAYTSELTSSDSCKTLTVEEQRDYDHIYQNLMIEFFQENHLQLKESSITHLRTDPYNREVRETFMYNFGPDGCEAVVKHR